MNPEDQRFTRRKLLSAGVVGVGALGLGVGGARMASSNGIDYTRTTVAQSEDGEADLIVDWKEWYNGDPTEDVQDEPTDSDGMPVVTLENVVPGDSGKLAFGLTLDEDSTAEGAELRMRVRLFPEETHDNGQTQPELAAGDDAADEGELQEYVEVDAWYDTGFRANDTPLYGHCNGEFDGAFEEKFFDGSLEGVAATTDTWDPDDGGVASLACVDRGDGLCVALEWALPEDLPGVDDNIVQSDRTAFEIGFAATDCET